MPGIGNGRAGFRLPPRPRAVRMTLTLISLRPWGTLPMTRRLAVALGLLGVAAVADAQPRITPATPVAPAGYIAIRVRLADVSSTAPGGQPGGPGFPGGQPGEGPGFPGGQPGFPGGQPGGFPGLPAGQPGFPGGQPGGQPGAPATAEAPSLVVTVQHKGLFKRLMEPTKNKNVFTNPEWVPMVRTPYGETLLLDSAPFQVYKVNTPTLGDELKKKHDRDVVPATARRNELLFELIKQAVEWNQIDQSMAYTKELIKWTDGGKEPNPDAPATAPTSAAMFLKAFKEIEPKLSQPLPVPDEAKQWQERLGENVTVTSSQHYALLSYGGQFISDDGVSRRLEALERNLKAFYLVHALRGKALPFPDKQLLVVLAKRGGELGPLNRSLDGGPISNDAFYSQVHNLLVLSPERTDDLSKSFLRLAKEQYKEGWNQAELLKGKAPPVDGNTTKPEDVARVMTFTLVAQALEDEAITAAVTGDGTRQLAATLGLLPKYVLLPRWVEDGLTSLYQTPRNPGVVAIAGKPNLTLGIGAGYGSPNYVLLRQFKEFQAANDFPAAEVLLTRVLTDAYFDAWRDGQDLDVKKNPQLPGGPPAGPGPGGPPPGGFAPGGPGAPALPGGQRGSRDSNPELAQGSKAGGQPGFPGPGMPGGEGGMPGQPGGVIEIDHEGLLAARLEARAHVTAWALVHYITATEKQRGNWDKFAVRLHQMPRDMKLEKNSVLLAFAESFDLATGGEIDKPKFKSFAEDWMSAMKSARPTWRLEKVREDEPANPGGIGPGFPGGPGGPGFPGGPGGGGFPGGPGGPGGGR